MKEKASMIRHRLFSDIYPELPESHPLIQLQDEMMKIPKWRLKKDFKGEFDIMFDRIMERNHPDIFKKEAGKP